MVCLNPGSGPAIPDSVPAFRGLPKRMSYPSNRYPIFSIEDFSVAIKTQICTQEFLRSYLQIQKQLILTQNCRAHHCSCTNCTFSS